MPTYQYRCMACDRELEAIQKFSDPALTTCLVCDGDLREVYSTIGAAFKSSGFYATDSRRSTSASKPTSGPETETDSAPAKSTEIAKVAS